MSSSRTLQAPTPKVFAPLLRPARYKGAHGGRGSGKSHFFAEEVVLRCIQEHTRAVCIREVQNTMQDSVHQLIVDKIVQFGVEHLFEITDSRIYGPHESLIIFRGMQHYNATNIKSLEGFDVAWVEEAQDFSQESFDQLAPTLRKDGSELWFSWNPDSEDDAVDKFFRGAVKHPDAVCVEANWSDNPYFPDVLRVDMERDYEADPEKAAHVWGGQYRTVMEGAYYARLLVDARNDGRIGDVPIRHDLPVYTAWDLGIGDDTSIVFVQRVGGWLHVIDHYANAGEPASHYVDIVKAKEYSYARHYLPHDAEVRDWISGHTRIDVLRNLGLQNIQVIPKIPVDDGINAVRSLLPTMRFHEPRTKELVKHLMRYRRDKDAKREILKDKPLHDENSHDADAMRYLCLGLEPEAAPVKVPRYSQARRRGTMGAPSAWTA